MITWIRDRLPTAADADPFGMVRWNPMLPGMLIPWHEVRTGEVWSRSAAWQENSEHGH
jgi:hypothetical protein